MEHALILALIGIALLLFAFEVARPDIIAIGVALVLILSGTLSVQEGFAGFSNPAVITVICMFILSAGLVRTGVADIIAKWVLKIGGKSPIMLTVAVMLAVGTMSMFMNNIGAVAVMLPVMFAIAERSGYAVSKLLIPLAFGSLLGGLVTLIGTPPNLLVSMALEDAGYTPFKLFDFAPTGLAVMATGILYMALVGRFLLPVRTPEMGEIAKAGNQPYLSKVVIPADSPFIGKRIGEIDFAGELKLTIVELRRGRGYSEHDTAVPGDHVLAVGDRLVVEGRFDDLLRARDKQQLALYVERRYGSQLGEGEDAELAEMVVAPNSRLLGMRLRDLDFPGRFGVVTLGLRRHGQLKKSDYRAMPLQTGDVLLVQGMAQALAELASSTDFVVVQKMENISRDRRRAPLALAIMGAAILAAATGVLHISVAGLLGVLLMVLTGCVPARSMYESVEWRVIVLIACMIPLGTAMDQDHTGTAKWLADQIVGLTGGAGPLIVMASLFLFTTMITEVMSNAAAAVLLAPIGIAIAVGMGVDPHPFMMAIAIGASTTFLTPIGHQANVLVYGVGNYHFADFARVGAILNVLIFLVAMAVIPLVWPFELAG